MQRQPLPSNVTKNIEAWRDLFKFFLDPKRYYPHKSPKDPNEIIFPHLDIENLSFIIDQWENFRKVLQSSTDITINKLSNSLKKFFLVKSLGEIPANRDKFLASFKNAIERQIAREILPKTSLYFASLCGEAWLKDVDIAITKLQVQNAELQAKQKELTINASWEEYEKKKKEKLEYYETQMANDPFFKSIENEIIQALNDENTRLKSVTQNDKITTRKEIIAEVITSIDNCVKIAKNKYFEAANYVLSSIDESFVVDEFSERVNKIKQDSYNKINTIITEKLINNPALKENDWGIKFGNFLRNILRKIPGVKHFFGESNLFKPKKSKNDQILEDIHNRIKRLRTSESKE